MIGSNDSFGNFFSSLLQEMDINISCGIENFIEYTDLTNALNRFLINV